MNLREAIERLLERQSAVVSEALQGAESATQTTASPTAAQAVQGSMTDDGSRSQPPSEPNAESPRRQAQRARRQRRVERFDQVRERHRQGQSLRQIARELRMSRRAVRRYLRYARACRRSHPARRIDPGRYGGSFHSVPPDRGLRESTRQRAQRDHTDFRWAIGRRWALPDGRLNALSRSRFRLAPGEVPRKSRGLITHRTSATRTNLTHAAPS